MRWARSRQSRLNSPPLGTSPLGAIGDIILISNELDRGSGDKYYVPRTLPNSPELSPELSRTLISLRMRVKQTATATAFWMNVTLKTAPARIPTAMAYPTSASVLPISIAMEELGRSTWLCSWAIGARVANQTTARPISMATAPSGRSIWRCCWATGGRAEENYEFGITNYEKMMAEEGAVLLQHHSASATL